MTKPNTSGRLGWRRTLAGVLLSLPLALLLACSDSSAPASLDAAGAYVEQGDLAAAAIELKNVLQADPENAAARLLLGQVHFQAGNMPGAAKELRRAQAAGAAVVDVLPLQSRVLLAEQDYEALAELSLETTDSGPRAILLTSQGLGLLAQSDSAGAQELVEQALQLEPELVYAQVARARIAAVQGAGATARTMLDGILKRNPRQYRAWSLQGDLESQTGNLEAAAAAYGKAIELAEFQLQDRLKRAVVLTQLGNYDLAQEDVTILKIRAPEDPGVNYVQGLIHYRQQEWQSAVTAFAWASQDRRRYPLAVFYSAVANNTLGNIDLALANAYEFHSIRPGDAEGRRLLAFILLSRSEFAEAEAILRPLVGNTSRDTAAFRLYGSALLGLERMDEAINALDKAAALAPASAAGQLRVGLGMLLSGDVAQGVGRLETAMAMDPGLQQTGVMLALTYLHQGEFDKAIAEAKSYQARNPVRAAPQILLGRISLRAGDLAAAREAFEAARALEPTNPSPYLNLANLALHEGDYATARALCEEVLAAHKNHLTSLLTLAKLEALQNNEAGMISGLQRAIEAHPQAAQPRLVLARYYLTSQQAEKVSMVLGPLEQQEETLPVVLRELGLAEMQKGEFAAAQHTFQRLLQQLPDSVDGAVLLASAYMGAGDSRSALQQLDRALDTVPGDYEARLARARVYIGRQEFSRAQKDLLLLESNAATEPEVFQLSARVAQALGDQDAALASYSRAHAALASSASLSALSGQLLAMGDVSGAVQAWESWVEKHPEDINTRLALASVYGQLNQPAKAAAQYQAVLERDNENIGALNNLAWQLRQSDTTQALEYARRAAALDRDSAAVLDTLAIVLLHANDLAGARRAIAQALAKTPGEPTFRYHSAMIDLNGGDADSARKTLQALLAESLEFPEKAAAERLLAQL